MMNPHQVFSALSDQTRLEVLARLASSGPSTATELSAVMPISRQAVSKHLTALVQAGLVERNPVGREVRFSFHSDPLDDIAQWASDIGTGWDRRLENLRRSMQ